MRYGLIHKLVILLFAGCLLAPDLFPQPALNYRPVISSLASPIDIVSANDGTKRLFIVQKEGVIKVYDASLQPAGDFLTVTGISTAGERGLLSMAFHPDFKSNGFFFVYYTTSVGSIEVARYKVGTNPNIADPASRFIIITIPHPTYGNHNGGKLNFGSDGYLYFATGDGGGGGDPFNNGQNPASLLGKMLRIDVDQAAAPLNYSIPPDNPFVNDATVADEIWAMGLRNPWRWSFDRQTQDMWIGDVGQNAREEINFLKGAETKGVNFGWRCYEGKRTYNVNGCRPVEQYIEPVFDYPHNNATGGFSVTGGYVYRGGEYPSLNGYYIFADYVSGNQWMAFDSSGNWVVEKQTGTFPGNISSFGEGEDGTLYACSLTGGTVYKIEAITGVDYILVNFNGTARNGIAELNWSATEQNLLHYELERSTDSIHFSRRETIPARNQPGTNHYSFTDNMQGADRLFYRLRIENNNGNWDYSTTIAVHNNAGGDNLIIPSFITNKTVSLFVSEAQDLLEIFSMNGALVLKKDIRGQTGRLDLPIPHLANGIYLVRISVGNSSRKQYIFVN